VNGIALHAAFQTWLLSLPSMNATVTDVTAGVGSPSTLTSLYEDNAVSLSIHQMKDIEIFSRF
jgi:hypothetical protein